MRSWAQGQVVRSERPETAASRGDAVSDDEASCALTRAAGESEVHRVATGSAREGRSCACGLRTKGRGSTGRGGG